MGAGTVAGIAVQLVVVGVVGFSAGDLALRWAHFLPSRKGLGGAGPGFVHLWSGWPERALAAIWGAVAFSVVMMAGNVLSRGALFGSTAAVPIAGIVCVGLNLRFRGVEPRPRFKIRTALAVVLFGLVLAWIFVLPALSSGSSIRTGDPPWHLGWTEQLLGGEAVPTGPAAGFARNAYPWGLHALMATTVRLTPGTDPAIALETLHVVLVVGITLAAACLARRIRQDAGWAAAGAVSLIGGFGWIVARGAAFVTSPRGARYGADLVVASPNGVYELFPPGLPRELGLVLLGAAASLLLVGVRKREPRALLLGGAVAGLCGLVSVPMFVSALVWLAAMVAIHRGERARLAARVFGAALAVFALWAVPVVIDLVRFGGFVNITPRLGMEWDLVTALASWGILLPLAIAGFVFVARYSEIEGRTLLAWTIGTGILLSLTIARGWFDWSLAGNATLLHQGRVWPPAHLLAAVFAGVALTRAFELIEDRPRVIVAVAGLVLAALAVASPILASRSLSATMEAGRAGFVYGTSDIQAADGFLRSAARHLTPRDTVLVPDNDELAFLLFQFSGCRLATYDDPRLDHNDLRIRFRDLAARWDATIREGGFEHNYVVVRYPLDGPSGEEPMATGTFHGRTYALLDNP